MKQFALKTFLATLASALTLTLAVPSDADAKKGGKGRGGKGDSHAASDGPSGKSKGKLKGGKGDSGAKSRGGRGGGTSSGRNSGSGTAGGHGVPELDPGTATSAITLLVGGAAIALERRRRFGGLNKPKEVESNES